MDKEITEVIFRKFKPKYSYEGCDVIALFPNEAYNYNGNILSYQTVGQHGEADYNVVLSMSELATKEESAKLKKELEGIGYNLKVLTRRNYKKFTSSLL